MIQINMNPRALSFFLLIQIAAIVGKALEYVDTWFLALLPSTLIGLIALTSYVGIMTTKTSKERRVHKERRRVENLKNANQNKR